MIIKSLALSLLLMLGPQWVVGSRAFNHTTAGGGGAVTYTGNGCSNSSSGSSSITCTTVSNVTAGQTIYVNATQYASGQVATLTDTNSGTITLILGGTNGTTYQGEYDWVWQITNAGAGSHTFTVADSSGSYSYISLIADVLSRGAVDGTPSALGAQLVGGVSQNNCGTVTTTAANEFILTFGNVSGGGQINPGTTPQEMTAAQAASVNDTSAYGIAATAGANYAGWYTLSSATWICDTIAVH